VLNSDRNLLALVLQNLVGNAVKYSDRGTVTVGATLAPAPHQTTYVLSVADEGPGIPADQAVHIFEAFRRGDGRGCPGAGLGLAIASEAARLLGAELSLMSAVGAGSTFRLVLRSPAS
jgi:signal transduction histidine kinase